MGTKKGLDNQHAQKQNNLQKPETPIYSNKHSLPWCLELGCGFILYSGEWNTVIKKIKIKNISLGKSAADLEVKDLSPLLKPQSVFCILRELPGFEQESE